MTPSKDISPQLPDILLLLNYLSLTGSRPPYHLIFMFLATWPFYFRFHYVHMPMWLFYLLECIFIIKTRKAVFCYIIDFHIMIV